MKLSKKVNFKNLKRISALLLVIIVLISMISCKKKDIKDNESNNSSTQSQTDNGNSSNNFSSEEVSSEQNSSDVSSVGNSDNVINSTTNTDKETKPESSKTSNTSISPFKGDVTGDYTYGASGSRSDADEIEHAVDPAGNEKKLVGYCDDERNKLRDEILNTPNTAELYDIKGTIYYVSTKGSDANDGLSPKTPIRTLFEVDALTLKPGDAVLFERGCVWRLTESLDCRSGVIYGSYGEGRKPMILGSPKNFAQEVWRPSNKKNVWQMSYIYSNPGGIFFNEGEQIGYNKLGLRDLKKNTDFYLNTETSTLYVYCDKGNPSNVWDSIEVSQTYICINFTNGNDGTVFDNFTVRYCATHTVSGAYGNKNMTVTNCELGFGGGSWIGNNPGSNRYGNAIQSWCGGYGFVANHNWIYQTFDSAITPQGNNSKKHGDYANISICDNLLEYNNADLEFWDGIGDSGLALFKNVVCDNNMLRFTALGWGTRADDGGIRGIDGLIYGNMALGQLKSFSFSNNIIDCPGTHMYKFGIKSYDEYRNFKRVGNIFHIKQSYRWTNALISTSMVWIDEGNILPTKHKASNKADTIKAFAEFEPGATVYWYK